MVSLLMVRHHYLDGLVMELVDVNSLEVDLSDFQLIHHSNREGLDRMPVVDPLLPNPNVDDHVVQVVDIRVLWLWNSVSPDGRYFPCFLLGG